MTNRDKVIIDMMRGEAQHVVARRYRMHDEQVRRIVSEYLLQLLLTALYLTK